MSQLLHELVTSTADRSPQAIALEHRNRQLTYAQLAQQIEQTATGLVALGLGAGERVAMFLPKQVEAVLSMFGAAAAGCTFVPVNPILKPAQIDHIMADCDCRVLVTSRSRARDVLAGLDNCTTLHTLVLVDGEADALDAELIERCGVRVISWAQLGAPAIAGTPHRRIDADVVSILYTSGSTGSPKGVVLSHKNMVTGALSVSTYLQNTPQDRLLAVLPFSFDYGFSQLSTAFATGACVVLMDYLLPRDVVRAVEKYRITGLAAVPPLWVQLAQLEWPDGARETLRYCTNSGGAMPEKTLAALREQLPAMQFFLMYGLTEAFRSTYLPPHLIDQHPDSMGQAIPNAQIMVVREDGTECDANEVGELVHRGALVSLGYWNDPERTQQRFRPSPGQDPALPLTELAVWSGDFVRRDEQGLLYFVGRRDEMIKTSGYRVSPTEIEEHAYGSGLVAEAAALGLPHPALGHAVVLAVVAKQGDGDTEALLAHFKKAVPAFMVPSQVRWYAQLPRNPNGKLDRKQLAGEFDGSFEEIAV